MKTLTLARTSAIAIPLIIFTLLALFYTPEAVAAQARVHPQAKVDNVKVSKMIMLSKGQSYVGPQRKQSCEDQTS